MESSVEGSESKSCKSVTAVEDLEEGEIVEKEHGDSNTLTTNVSSFCSSPTGVCSSYTTITPASTTHGKPSPTKELCPKFTTTGTDIYNLH